MMSLCSSVSKSDEVHETDKGSDDSDTKRKQSTTDSHDLIRKRPRFASLRTRTSPKTLHDTIKGLTPEQKTAVKDMGLGALVDMTIVGVPSKLGFYIVDMLDTRKMQLDLRSGSIAIKWSLYMAS
ncbi:hypothetical protein L6452_37680 [Arctium lappa]|uniref:Uncharacterized protein n=1 Tax=Arctium lappa TaxID=4217 RepID=A0ACB8Y4R0_ARCLA|nr:hypothetical protein L6452_37680 [Arctium lappa]